MRRKANNDDVRMAWSGANASLAGSNGLIVGLILALAMVKVMSK